jgi:ABC-type uncharacterized transport system auxiliary subunit
MSTLNRLFRGVAYTALVISLTGCVSLLPSPGPAPMFLMISPKNQPSGFSSSASLVIDEPTSPIMIDSTKIVVQKTNPSGLVNLTYVNEQEWAERLPRMLQRIIVDHFRSETWPGVSAESTAGADYRLNIDIRKFQITMPGSVDVTVNFTLTDARDHRAIASQTYNYQVLAQNSMTGYTTAFDQAVGMLLKDAAVMLKRHIKSDEISFDSTHMLN